MRLAKVTIRTLNSDDTRDSLSHDPIALPTVSLPGGVVLVPTDFDDLNRLIELAQVDEADQQLIEYGLVWESNGEPVKAACPACGDIGEAMGEMVVDEDTLVCHNCI